MKKSITITTLLIAAIGLAAFTFNPKKSVKKERSQINFAISHGHCNLTGVANITDAQYSFTDKDMKDLKIDFAFATKSIKTGIEGENEYDKKLKSPAIFGASKTIKFECDDNFRLGHNWFQMRGKLTMHGVTNKERFRATRVYDNEGNLLKFIVEGRVDLTDYNIDYAQVDPVLETANGQIMFLNFEIEA